MITSPGIYKITNSINNNIYIGSAISIKKRIGEHIRKLKRGAHENKRLQNSWNKYGESAFVFTVEEIVEDVSMLTQREQFFIDLLNSSAKPNFNICPNAGSQLGLRHSEETKAKMSASRAGRKRSAETVNKIAAANRGKKRSPEICAQMAEARRGKPMHQNAKEALAKANNGRKHSEETKAKIGAGNKGKIVSEEARKKLSISLKGNKNTLGLVMSDQAKQKLSTIAIQKNYASRLNRGKSPRSQTTRERS